MLLALRGEDSSVTGVNGNASDNLSNEAGAAYVFTRSGTTWSQQAYLKASNTDAYDDFGRTIAISGDVAIVGAPNEASSLDWDENDNSAPYSGAAYVFVRNGTTWTQAKYLKATVIDSGDSFGSSLAISGYTVVVRRRVKNSNANTVGGDMSDNSASSAGAVHVFEGDGVDWYYWNYLKASNADAYDSFGTRCGHFRRWKYPSCWSSMGIRFWSRSSTYGATE